MLAKNKKWHNLPSDRRKTLIHAVAQDIGQQLRGEIMLSTALNRYLLERIEQTLEEVTAAQEAAARRGVFAHAFAKLTFGGAKSTLPGLEIQTPARRKIFFQGDIDRVDIVAYLLAFATIDY